jgi:hypothetical protein
MPQLEIVRSGQKAREEAIFHGSCPILTDIPEAGISCGHFHFRTDLPHDEAVLRKPFRSR